MNKFALSTSFLPHDILFRSSEDVFFQERSKALCCGGAVAWGWVITGIVSSFIGIELLLCESFFSRLEEKRLEYPLVLSEEEEVCLLLEEAQGDFFNSVLSEVMSVWSQVKEGCTDIGTVYGIVGLLYFLQGLKAASKALRYASAGNDAWSRYDQETLAQQRKSLEKIGQEFAHYDEETLGEKAWSYISGTDTRQEQIRHFFEKGGDILRVSDSLIEKDRKSCRVEFSCPLGDPTNEEVLERVEELLSFVGVDCPFSLKAVIESAPEGRKEEALFEALKKDKDLQKALFNLFKDSGARFSENGEEDIGAFLEEVYDSSRVLYQTENPFLYAAFEREKMTQGDAMVIVLIVLLMHVLALGCFI